MKNIYAIVLIFRLSGFSLKKYPQHVKNQEKSLHKKSRLQKTQTAKEGTCQIVKSLPISLYNQIIHVLHHQDQLQRTASYDLMLWK